VTREVGIECGHIGTCSRSQLVGTSKAVRRWIAEMTRKGVKLGKGDDRH
jgi:hypothetical protein